MEKRVFWIDNCKALAISLVALGHIQSVFLANEIIFAFALPSFFFLSGYTFERSAKSSFWELVQKKFRSLVIPYFGFSAILFAFWFLVRRHFGMSVQAEVSPVDVLLQILWGTNSDFFVTPLWFLTCLFMTEICFWLLCRLHRAVAAVVVVTLFVYGIYYWYSMDLLHLSHAFWNVDQLCFYLYFFSAGYVFFKKGWIEKLLGVKKRNVLLVAVSALIFAGAFWIRENSSSMGLVLPMQALMCNAGLLAFLAVVKTIPENIVLNFIGQNTLTILALHLMVQSLLRGALAGVFHMDVAMLGNSFLVGVALTVITLVLLVPEILLINRFTPWLAGKRNR